MMTFRIKYSLLVVFVCLTALGCGPLDKPEKPLVYDYPQAADEHRNYISMLETEGGSVHTVTNTLLSMHEVQA